MNRLIHSGTGLHIKVKDITASRKFYEDLLDLVPVFGYGDAEFRSTLPAAIPSVMNDGFPGAPERYRGVTYEPAPQCPIEIAEGHIGVPNQAVFREPITSPKVSAMMRVASLLPLVREKGLRPVFPIRHYYWGTIEIAIKDPDGFVLVIIAPFSEGELEELRKLVDVEEVLAG